MKRILSLLLTLMLAAGLLSAPAQAVNTKTKSRTIHVVYDDSGSMAAHGVTRWSQAKYALEVFAAMMGKDDRMVIYPMSSYSYRDLKGEDGTKCPELTLTLNGSDSVSARIEKINQMNGDGGIYRNTPIETASRANSELKKSQADEKWLIVLTDGVFDHGKHKTELSKGEISKEILSYVSEDVRVAYVSIGSQSADGKETVVSLTDQRRENFYPYDADENNILSTVTEIATTVFNYQPVPSLSGNGEKRFSTDIPVSKVIVFAQGKDARVDKLSVGGSTASPSASVEVSVPASTSFKPRNKGYDVKVAGGLKGCVVTYEAKDDSHPFPDGDYSFGCSTDDVDVFYEPGVDVQAVLADVAGDEVNVSDESTQSIEAGTKQVKILLVNPLTGAAIDPDSSAMVSGAVRTLTVKDSRGGLTTCKDGESITIPEGEVELFAKVAFKGDVEKNSRTSTLKVEPAQLKITFDSENGYTLNPATLELSSPIRFRVEAGDGSALTKEELSAMELTVAETPGLKWTATPADENGTFQLVPEYAGDGGAAEVDTHPQTLTVQAAMNADGVHRQGSGSTQLAADVQGTLELKLNLQMPEERDGYMFDCQQRGTSEDAPSILVAVSLSGEDGSQRPLSEEEWRLGEKGFRFRARQVNSNPLWKLIALVCRQTLDFDVALGEEPSTYRLYLSGLTAAQVLPNSSELEVELSIELPNGIQERGTDSGVVSVKPLSPIFYLWLLLVILALVAVILLILIMELRKPRFDRAMYPNTRAILTRAGVPVTAPMPPQVSRRRVSYSFWPPWRAEERDVTLKYPGYLDTPVTFHCLATGSGSFVITNPEKFKVLGNRVRINGMTLDSLLKNPSLLTMNSDITVYVTKGNIKGRLELTFCRPQNSKKR